MTKEKNEQKSTSKAPSHYAYHVRNRDDGTAFWTRIGVAWGHADAKGFTAQLNCVPLDGKISLRLIDEKNEQSA